MIIVSSLTVRSPGQYALFGDSQPDTCNPTVESGVF